MAKVLLLIRGDSSMPWCDPRFRLTRVGEDSPLEKQLARSWSPGRRPVEQTRLDLSMLKEWKIDPEDA